MKQYIRLSSPIAEVVATGLDVDMLWGSVNAWAHLRRHHVPPDVALRILSNSGARRDSDASHPAQPSEQLRALKQMANSRTTGTTTRRNKAMSQVVDGAIHLSITRGIQYAEALLKLYPVSSHLIMRVLFDAEHRRRLAPQPPPAPGKP